VQDVVAILIAVMSAVFLARKTWLRLAGQAGKSCGACHGCGANESIKSRPLVNISLDMSRATPNRR
jgi:hypothetical protein